MQGKCLRILAINEEVPIIRLLRKCFRERRCEFQAITTGKEGIINPDEFLLRVRLALRRIAQLRQKLSVNTNDGYIANVPGVGYQLLLHPKYT